MLTSQREPAEAPLISVIIPCFNSGQYLQEALDSVAAYAGPEVYEIIIVNDGSTDAATIALLGRLEAEGYQVLHQVNKGPAAARNTGILASQGEYLLFLDSDNKLRPAFFEVGSRVLRQYPQVGVVHGNAAFFGEEGSPRFRPRPFDIYSIIAHNYVDMCAMVRKTAWEQVGGLDENRLLIGHEDWEFWLSLHTAGWHFYFVDQVLFDYRVGSESLVAQATHGDKYTRMRQYVYQKHWQLVAEAYAFLAEEYSAYKYDKGKPLRSFTKYLYGKLSVKKR
jgi:glycosyltransferase involved in cell wall biosynthesis